MSRTRIWTQEADDTLAEIWASDATPDELPGLMLARTGLSFSYGAMLAHARKMGLYVGNRPSSMAAVRQAEMVERVVEGPPRRVVERVRLVVSGTFPVPVGGFTMIGGRG